MKKIASMVITLVFVFGFAACSTAATAPAQATASPADSTTPSATTEPSTQLPNPIVAVDGSADFAALGVTITPHQQAESVSYSIIGGTVAQINFTLDGKTYTYRGAATTDDISGVYETFDPNPQSLDLEGSGFKISVVVKTIDGGNKGALAVWSYEDIQYSFYTPDKTDFDQLTDVLLPILHNDLPFSA